MNPFYKKPNKYPHGSKFYGHIVLRSEGLEEEMKDERIRKEIRFAKE
jgi:hypothetical protein